MPEPLLRCPQPNTLAITSPSKQPDPDKGVWDSDCCPKQGNMAQKDYVPALTGTTCNSWAPPDLSFPASLSLQTGCWHFPDHECRSRECQTGTGLGLREQPPALAVSGGALPRALSAGESCLFLQRLICPGKAEELLTWQGKKLLFFSLNLAEKAPCES